MLPRALRGPGGSTTVAGSGAGGRAGKHGTASLVVFVAAVVAVAVVAVTVTVVTGASVGGRHAAVAIFGRPLLALRAGGIIRGHVGL